MLGYCLIHNKHSIILAAVIIIFITEDTVRLENGGSVF